MESLVDPTALRLIAQDCDRQSAELEEAVRRSNEIAAHERDLVRLIRDCNEQFEDFLLMEATLRSHWAKKPDAYDASLDTALSDVDSMWFTTYRRLVRLLDRIDLDLEGEGKARDFYANMVSIEQMDQGVMPDHIREKTERAIGEWEKDRKG